MNLINKTYLKILNESKNYYGYVINDEIFFPFEYKRVLSYKSEMTWNRKYWIF